MLSTVDLLVPTRSDEVLLLLNNLFLLLFFLQKAILMRRPTVLNLPSQLVFRGKSKLWGPFDSLIGR